MHRIQSPLVTCGKGLAYRGKLVSISGLNIVIFTQNSKLIIINRHVLPKKQVRLWSVEAYGKVEVVCQNEPINPRNAIALACMAL